MTSFYRKIKSEKQKKKKKKKQCYLNNISVKEYFASVPLQNLPDYTALRIIQEQIKESITEVVEDLPESQQLM